MLITLSCIFTLSHPTLHIVLAVAPPYDNALKTCEEVTVAAQIGVQRLLGLYYIMQTSCDKPGEILFPDNLRVVHYIAPPLTMVLYYVLVLETRRWLDSREQAGKLVVCYFLEDGFSSLSSHDLTVFRFLRSVLIVAKVLCEAKEKATF
ncbi:Piezo-type mechanosensitive ion channel component [Fasciolopsis buskii]|uniref:Piezo-type mechanosensitive ion channel component n=1 Tax=Fasciolopsis buskii TaxID=27845 RepID=A0A8E0RQT2_9TREM|nr:Piezo-type mechanosensitive ion channel component [Fasciolopsis buski]